MRDTAFFSRTLPPSDRFLRLFSLAKSNKKTPGTTFGTGSFELDCEGETSEG